MKYIFASDIHGSYFWLRKLIDKFEEIGAESLILMGDLLYHGARNDLPGEYDTKKCTALFNEYQDKIIACKGNCDSEVDQMVLQFPIESRYNLLELNGIRFFQTHGHYYSPENLPPMGTCDAFVFGHIHLPIAEKRGDIYVLNPGSTSIPKGGNPNSYAVLDEGTFTIYDFEGNVIKSIEII